MKPEIILLVEYQNIINHENCIYLYFKNKRINDKNIKSISNIKTQHKLNRIFFLYKKKFNVKIYYNDENSFDNIKLKKDYITISYFNYWELTDYFIDNFLEKTFHKKINRVDVSNYPDILICSVARSLKYCSEKKSRYKILFIGEPNIYIQDSYYNKNFINNTFDLILSFDKDNDKNIRFPIWIKYHPFNGFEEFKKGNHFLNSIRKNREIKPLNNNAVLIASHKGLEGNYRQEYYNILKSNNIDVKCPGKFLHNCCKIESGVRTWGGKWEYLLHHRFLYNICPENCIQEGYVTEKIFDALYGGSVPIYNGYEPPEPEIIRRDAYIFPSKDNLSERLKKGFNNFIIDPFTDDADKILLNYYIKLYNKLKEFNI